MNVRKKRKEEAQSNGMSNITHDDVPPLVVANKEAIHQQSLKEQLKNFEELEYKEWLVPIFTQGFLNEKMISSKSVGNFVRAELYRIMSGEEYEKTLPEKLENMNSAYMEYLKIDTDKLKRWFLDNSRTRMTSGQEIQEFVTTFFVNTKTMKKTSSSNPSNPSTQ